MTSAGHRDRQASRPGGGEEGTESCVGGTKCGRVSLPQTAPGVGARSGLGAGGWASVPEWPAPPSLPSHAAQGQLLGT